MFKIETKKFDVQEFALPEIIPDGSANKLLAELF